MPRIRPLMALAVGISIGYPEMDQGKCFTSGRPKTSEMEMDVYSLEADLMKDFQQHLVAPGSPFKIESYAQEFYYMNGRVDVVAVDSRDRLIAFEGKLSRWRHALNQAYRNSAFVDWSYVVLPIKAAETALNSESEFSRRGVGLVAVSKEGIKILLTPQPGKRLQPWISDKALVFLMEGNQHEYSEVGRNRT